MTKTLRVWMSMTIEGSYKHFWLKYVRDVDLSQHCKKCLVGPDHGFIPYKPGVYRDIVLDRADSEFYYLCGLSYPYEWKNNFHLAMIRDPGEEFTYTMNGVTCEVHNATQVPILEVDRTTCTLPYKDDPAYYTCRNWQFAVAYAGLKKEEPCHRSGTEGRRSYQMTL